MGKTINKDIDIFSFEILALRQFDRTTYPCDVLKADFGRSTSYFIDRSKTAIKDWPTKYTLIKTR